MKVVLAHNFYGSSAPSGENEVFLTELELLRKRGHTVVEFTRHSDSLRKPGLPGAIMGGLRGAASTPWNVFSGRAIQSLLERERPDVLHVHNTFPLLSPSILHAARSFPVATVLTLHNYRIFCAAGIPMRQGKPCTKCLDQRSTLPALRNGCYRGSALSTLPVAGSIHLHRRLSTWSRAVDAFIALTAFQRDLMIGAGLPSETMHVKPHFYPDPPLPIPWSEREEKVVFVGRLSREKGLKTLILGWQLMGDLAPRLEIIGEGPDYLELRRLVQDSPVAGRIIFRGRLPFEQVQEEVAGARLLVLPSLCFEGFPMTIREAFALGVPVVASRLGSMGDIVVDGYNGALFPAGDPVALMQLVARLWSEPARLAEMAQSARRDFEANYTADRNYNQLMEIYESARSRRHVLESNLRS